MLCKWMHYQLPIFLIGIHQAPATAGKVSAVLGRRCNSATLFVTMQHYGKTVAVVVTKLAK